MPWKDCYWQIRTFNRYLFLSLQYCFQRGTSIHPFKIGMAIDKLEHIGFFPENPRIGHSNEVYGHIEEKHFDLLSFSIPGQPGSKMDMENYGADFVTNSFSVFENLQRS